MITFEKIAAQFGVKVQTPVNPNGYEQWEFGPFANGYGASIIRGSGSYGGPEGLYELAVLKDNNRHITHRTPITSDVLGFLTITKCKNLLRKIIAL